MENISDVWREEKIGKQIKEIKEYGENGETFKTF